MAPLSPTQSTKNAKWPTHLGLSGELILGEATSKDNVNEVSTSMYTHDGKEHALTLNVWGRDAPDQGTYLLTNIPFATHPLRLGVGDAAEMRHVPDEFDGMEPNSPTLPATFVFLTGIGVIIEADANRKGCSVAGFTYLNKKHGWQKWTLRLEFEETARWAAWTVPGARTLVTFDAVLVSQGTDGVYTSYIRRITSIGDADRSILTALNVGSPGGGDRAERLRRAREANRLAQEKKKKELDEGESQDATGEDNTSAVADSDDNTAVEKEKEDAPVTPVSRKGRRIVAKVDRKGKGKNDLKAPRRDGRGGVVVDQDTDEDKFPEDAGDDEDASFDNDEEEDEASAPARKVRRIAAR
ncbi:hypothetical protein CF319_g5361 [Tilletia indica]|nr:hypothetical protein CF319_g5361 [Tilletia indica]